MVALKVGFCEVSARRAVKPSGLNQSRELALPEGDSSMQSLHPFHGSIQEYLQELVDPNHNRPDHCPLCHGLNPVLRENLADTAILAGLAF